MCWTDDYHAGLSVALFAPAWVYEGDGNARSAWKQLDQELWDSLAAVLPAPKPVVSSLPFASDFNTGSGSALYAQVGLGAAAHTACRACDAFPQCLWTSQCRTAGATPHHGIQSPEPKRQEWVPLQTHWYLLVRRLLAPAHSLAAALCRVGG